MFPMSRVQTLSYAPGALVTYKVGYFPYRVGKLKTTEETSQLKMS